MYGVVRNIDYHVVQLAKDVPTFLAQILAGVDGQDFTESVTNTGWVGTCPQWRNFLPVVTVPKDELLGVDQLDFMMDEIACKKQHGS